jgi:hypothetical protein
MKAYILKRTDTGQYETNRGIDFDAPSNWTQDIQDAHQWLDRSLADDEQIDLAMLGIETDIVELN